MNWTSYFGFLAFALVLTVIPGPDTAVTIANALAGGRRRGMWCVAGIGCASILQATAAAAGLGVLLTTVEPVFLTIKWVGAAYLLYLAVQAFRSARRGVYPTEDRVGGTDPRALLGFRQGFLSNVCNPKIIAFYLAVLPQFLGESPSVIAIAVFAVSLPVIGCTYLIGVALGVDRARALFSRGRVRRAMDAVTGTALVAFGIRLATE